MFKMLKKLFEMGYQTGPKCFYFLKVNTYGLSKNLHKKKKKAIDSKESLK